MSTNKIARWLPRPELVDCWELMKLGVKHGMFDDDDARDVLTQLRNGDDLIIEELAFEVLGDSLRVKFHGEEAMCDPVTFAAELERALASEPSP